ncbi:GntR family transcriptional regulator [Streptomyces sp. GQFP]|uniref:GntR family transcriptional regulator n=1 Tax=Streptomyces sp. GQFP TaxID=2907545 RepID=UPI001F2545F5|nr:GntR family transcriptional regulator [Streptomyces sp. GQFP]UIX29274.1 GntR family transcriptional regulator [Streptomyces sp. GQFP]
MARTTRTQATRAGQGPGGRDSAYVRLARELREAILRHEYPEGVRLPTEAELAASRGLSRQTVRRAFQDLVAEGLVHRVPGRGTFAAPREEQYLRQFGSVEDLMALSLDTTMRLVSPLRRRVDLDAAGRLRLDSDRVDTLTFLRLHEDTPFCLTTVHLPPGAGQLLADRPELTEEGARSRVTVIGLLDSRLPDPIAEAEQSVTVGLATPETAARLGCPPAHPLLRIDRLYLSATGHPVELAISHFLPEHYSYRVRLRRNLR